MKKDKFFIIGGGVLQVDFIKAVQKNGFLAYVFDYNPNCEGSKIADKFYCISIDAKEEILEIAKKEKPVAIHTVATEAGNVTACYVGEKLGLNTNSYETALNTTDKSRMKQILKNNDIPTAKSFQLTDISEFDKINIEFPFVVKPADRSAGRGISLVNNLKEFNIAFKDAFEQANNKVVLIEEYVKGKQYSIELVSNNGIHEVIGITEEYFLDEIFFVESHYLFPAIKEKQILDNFTDFFYNLLNVFKIKFGASHIEFRFDGNELKIIEIASRMGGLRDQLVLLSKGINYLNIIIKSITENKIVVDENKNRYSLAKWFFSKADIDFYKNLRNYFSVEFISSTKKDKKWCEKTPKTLMDSTGIYYVATENDKTANSLINVWSKNEDL